MFDNPSEFRVNRARTMRQRLYVAGVLAGLAGAFALVGMWDRAAFDQMADDALRAAVERTNFRPYFLSTSHCPAPRQGEVLHMRAAPDQAPGVGFECAYYVDGKYSLARRLTQLRYSRGWKQAQGGEL